MTNAEGYIFLLVVSLLSGVGAWGESRIKLFEVTPTDRVEFNETTDLNIRIEIRNNLNGEFNSSFRVTGYYFTPTYYQRPGLIFMVQNGQCSVNETMNLMAMTELVTCDLERGLFAVTIKNSTGMCRIEFQMKEDRYFNDSRSDYRTHYLGFKRPGSLWIKNWIKNKTFEYLTNVTLTPGDELTIYCFFRGGSGNKASFKWFVNTTMSPDDDSMISTQHQPWSTFRNGRYSSKFTSSRSLSSTGVREGDEGYYRCEALHNPEHVGRFYSQTVHINVIYKPETNPRTGTVPEVLYLFSGTTATLRWNVIANPAPEEVTWSRQGRALTEGSTYQLRTVQTMKGYEYSIQFTAGEDTFGRYQCEVTNSQGSSTIQFLVIEGKPSQGDVDDLEKPVEILTITTIAPIAALVLTVTVIVLAVIFFTKARPSRQSQHDNTTTNCQNQPNL